MSQPKPCISPLPKSCHMSSSSHPPWFNSSNNNDGRSQWPRGLRRRSAAARLLRLCVRIPSGAWMFVVSVVCCQVQVSVTGWSLVQRSPTDCGLSLCVNYKCREWGGPGPLEECWAKKKKSWWAEQIMQFLIMQPPPLPCHHLLLVPKYVPQRPIIEYPQPILDFKLSPCSVCCMLSSG